MTQRDTLLREIANRYDELANIMSANRFPKTAAWYTEQAEHTRDIITRGDQRLEHTIALVNDIFQTAKHG